MVGWKRSQNGHSKSEYSMIVTFASLFPRIWSSSVTTGIGPAGAAGAAPISAADVLGGRALIESAVATRAWQLPESKQPPRMTKPNVPRQRMAAINPAIKAVFGDKDSTNDWFWVIKR